MLGTAILCLNYTVNVWVSRKRHYHAMCEGNEF
ncbi:hypothetical protein ES703_97366 [subsurface metagenome]